MTGGLIFAGNDKDRLRRLATYASIGVSASLIVAKLVAYFLTDSVAMLSSLSDSTIDLVSSLVTAFGVASALRPPDHDHRFGHGKAEPLAALAQAAFIVGSSVLLCYEALGRIYHPHDIQNPALGYGVMAVAMVLGFALIRFQRYVIRRTGSMAIDADRLHYVGDIAINMAVIAAFAFYQWTGKAWLDPIFAICIAIALIASAARIAVRALNVLMDKEVPDAVRARIQAIVRAQPAVLGLHDLRTRTDGDRIFMEFHLELDPNMTLKAASHVSAGITEVLRREFAGADILIRQDPAGLQEERLDEQIAMRTPRA